LRYFIFIPLFLVGCTSETESELVSLSASKDWSDSIDLDEQGLRIMYNDFGLFDTSFSIFEFDMCTPLHNSGQRFSNSNFNCEDTLPLSYDRTLDSLLYMDLKLKIAGSNEYSTLNTLSNRCELHKAILAMTGNRDAEPLRATIFGKQGIEYGMFEFADTIDDNFYNSQCEIFGRIDSTIVSAQMSYMGRSRINYLDKFSQIARSVVVEEL
jgi:hypothetical protein